RDKKLICSFGFTGEFLGVYPGGGGYDFSHTDFLIRPVSEKKTILIKGYQGKHGRAWEVLQAIKGIQGLIGEYRVVVFGADKKLIELGGLFCAQEKVLVLGKILHQEVLKLMGESLLFIGNSMSDGTPNTLLEAF